MEVKENITSYKEILDTIKPILRQAAGLSPLSQFTPTKQRIAEIASASPADNHVKHKGG